MTTPGATGAAAAKELTLSANRIAEIRELFGLFDRANSGFVHVEDLGTMLRALHFNPSNEEILALIDTIDVPELSLAEVMAIVAELPAYPELETDLLCAFALFDKRNDGHVDVETVRYVLTKSYEPLLEVEVDSLLERVDIRDGRVPYDKLVKLLVS